MALKSKKKPKNTAQDVNNTSQEADVEEYRESSSAKKEKKKKEKTNKKKSKFPLFLILILLGAGALTLVLIFNIGNLRDKYIMPAMQNVPIIKNIIPKEQEEDEFSALSKDELVAQVKALTEDNKKLEDNNTDINNKLNDANKQIARLQEIEAQQLEFKQDKETFDSMIALNDPKAYQSFYEKIFPENADKLYKEVVGAAQDDKKLKNYVKTFENMKKDAAAAVFKEMMRTDMDLVVQILENISNEQRGNILSAMEPKDAAAVAKRLAPQ